MRFKAATDELTRDVSLSLSRIAERFGLTLNSISRIRSGSGANRMQPPANWRGVLAELARENAKELDARARDLGEIASELERAGGEG